MTGHNNDRYELDHTWN